MTLLHASSIGLAFGSRTILDRLTLTIEEGERVGLVGVNGSGKSSLLRILARAAEPDRGEVQLRRGASVTYLPQEPEFPGGSHGRLRARGGPGAAQGRHRGPCLPLGAHRQARPTPCATTGCSPSWPSSPTGSSTWGAGTPPTRPVGCSTGSASPTGTAPSPSSRAGRASAWPSPGRSLSRPDLLLLDEPTNHLDADTVDWLEDELDGRSGALVLVTHDRYFLDDLVDRMLEITPQGGVISWPGNYEAFLEQKLVAEEQSELGQHKRERWISQEVAWLRRGPEARRTKSKARIQRARALMAEKGFVRPRVADIQASPPPRLSQVVIEAHGLAKSFGDRKVLEDVEFILQRGERIGIVGPNGAGKTTFLRLLLGELQPDAGKVVTGVRTRVAYHDQQRAALDPEQTVYEAAGGGAPGKAGEDFVTIGDRRVGLRDYLDDLLFPPVMQRMKVGALSGGERNRLLLARLFLEGANVLVLDEPTNDLDLVTLNVLERLLLEFGGSVLLVTHDRYFLDKVATAILAFEGDGRAVRYPGNYEMYRTLKPPPERAGPAAPRETPRPLERKPSTRKLSFKEQRELEGIEAAILAAEERKSAAESALSEPATYQKGGDRIVALRAEMETAAAEAERLYARWQELERIGTDGAREGG